MNRLKDRKSLESLDYEIFDYSSHASTYFPENIKINDSLDPNSRWSTISNDHRQFLILKTPISIISNITFGKFSKIHVCNVKEMKISVSFDNLNYKEVFYGGLRNDIEPETFNLKTKINGELLISRFIKIEPLAAWGMNFNYSIWYVSLWGISEVKEILREQKEKLKVNQVKDCLKTLKSLGYFKEYESLSLKLGEENPVLSKIKNLIENEDFEGVEEYVLGLNPKIYEKFIKENGYVSKWEEIKKGSKVKDGNVKGSKDGNGINGKGSKGNGKGSKNRDYKGNGNKNNTHNWPCERGGHQMVTVGDKIYLYGGWNGLEELGDFWVYENEEWKCILPDSYEKNEKEHINYDFDHDPGFDPDFDHFNSPGKRSCHKMATNNSEIYLIGRYISSITRDINPVSNDIWVYKRGWYVLPSKDKNIPPNIYDHYLTYGDGVLYCFGGKQTDDDETYGGLYKIEIKEDCMVDGSMKDGKEFEDNNDNENSNHSLPTTSTKQTSPTISPTTSSHNNNTTLNSSGFFHNPIERWFTLREDLKQPSNTPQLRGRLGHSMIYIPKNHIPGNIHNNSLVIIGGQRGKENFKHIQFYSIDSDTVYETIQFPIKTEGRIIQRAHLYGEDLILLFTFGTEKDSKLDTFCLYSYSLIKNEWKEIKNMNNSMNNYDHNDHNSHPLPRSAHQFVKFKNHFLLFGGNVTDKSDKRQNDFWKLTLKRISIEEVKKILSFKIRKYKVLNLLDKGWKKIAVEFLQMEVKPLVTPKNANEFEKLCGEFFDRQDESELYEEIEKIIK